jgi:hypothetical protein
MTMEVDYAEEGVSWAQYFLRNEASRPGDYAHAMRRVARRAKVPFSLLWALHYRPSKRIATGQYALLGRHIAHVQQAKCHEPSSHLAKTALGKALLADADRLFQLDDLLSGPGDRIRSRQVRQDGGALSDGQGGQK